MRKAIVEAPTPASGLVYNGSKQTGVPEGEGYTLEGTAKAKNAGTYTAVATLKEGYVWSDGTSEPKEITWSIAKAPQDELAFDCPGTVKVDDQISLAVIGGTGDGAVTYEIVGGTGEARIENGQLVGVTTGTVIVTATKAGDANHEPVSVTATFTVTAKDVDPTPDPGPTPTPTPDPDPSSSSSSSDDGGSTQVTPSTGDEKLPLVIGVAVLAVAAGVIIVLAGRLRRK